MQFMQNLLTDPFFIHIIFTNIVFTENIYVNWFAVKAIIIPCVFYYVLCCACMGFWVTGCTRAVQGQVTSLGLKEWKL